MLLNPCAEDELRTPHRIATAQVWLDRLLAERESANTAFRLQWDALTVAEQALAHAEFCKVPDDSWEAVWRDCCFVMDKA